VRSISGTTTVRVYLLNGLGQVVANSKKDLAITTTTVALRKEIASAMGGAAPWVLAGNAVACWYRVVSGTGVFLGRNAVFGVSGDPTLTFYTGTDANPDGLEQLLPGEEGFLGRVNWR
jgi:hypothetical protein